MKFLNFNKKLVNINLQNYLIDWGCKERSEPQFKVKQFLKQYWEKQLCCREFPIPNTRLKIDIFNVTKRLVIEIDGINVHLNYNKFFHKNRLGYLNSIIRDEKKDQWCEMNRIQLIRIFDDEIHLLSPDFFKEKFGIILV